MCKTLLIPGTSRKTLAAVLSIKLLSNCEPYVLFSSIHPYLFSKYISKRILLHGISPFSYKYILTILEISLKYDIDYIMPLDYRETIFLSKYCSFFKKHGITIIAPPYDAIKRVSDKTKLPKIVKDIALYPKQIVIKSKNDLNDVYKIPLPLVVKGTGDRSLPEYFLSREDAISSALRRLPAIIQEYIPGIGRGYYVISFRGKPLLEFMHERIGEYYPTGGGSIAAQGPILDPRLLRIGRKLVRKLSWTGQLMIETKWDPETGDYYIIEFNPKFWGSIDLPVKLGFHFPGLLTIAFTKGYNKALKIAKSLNVRSGYYVWLINALHYLVYDEKFYFRLLLKSLRKPSMCDFDLLDPVHSIMKSIVSVKRVSSVEKKSYGFLMKKLQTKTYKWLEVFLEKTKNKEKTIIFDFDRTLVTLPINWSQILRELKCQGFAKPWENVSITLQRLWMEDKENYVKVSSIIEAYEMKAIMNAELLVERELIDELRKIVNSMYIVSKQSYNVVKSVLSMHKLTPYFKDIFTREKGLDKISIIKNNISHDSSIIIIDDQLTTVVKAYKHGYIGLHVSYRKYDKIQALSLGIPSGRTKELINFLLKVLQTT